MLCLNIVKILLTFLQRILTSRHRAKQTSLSLIISTLFPRPLREAGPCPGDAHLEWPGDRDGLYRDLRGSHPAGVLLDLWNIFMKYFHFHVLELKEENQAKYSPGLDCGLDIIITFEKWILSNWKCQKLLSMIDVRSGSLQLESRGHFVLDKLKWRLTFTCSPRYWHWA